MGVLIYGKVDRTGLGSSLGCLPLASRWRRSSARCARRGRSLLALLALALQKWANCISTPVSHGPTLLASGASLQRLKLGPLLVERETAAELEVRSSEAAVTLCSGLLASIVCLLLRLDNLCGILASLRVLHIKAALGEEGKVLLGKGSNLVRVAVVRLFLAVVAVRRLILVLSSLLVRLVRVVRVLNLGVVGMDSRFAGEAWLVVAGPFPYPGRCPA